MMRAVFRALVVQSFQVGLDGEVRRAFEHLGRMSPCGRLVADLGLTGGDECMVELVGRRDTPERRNRVFITARNEIGPAEMVPEPLGMIGIEAHCLLDPFDAFLGPSEPRQDLALLHDDEVVVAD